ncbi:Hsp20/alpha crystallin family protein [Streptomyces sp. NBC_01233]|uniref:Hsp20/alpha crystallin family protein n=1 Tax=Streptomyces sp. NBC_01233 TaxID=2903787 RepID=UPI002E0E67E0|nr:Hsp20/alpha crystallin family protein [Streptomyces sp. NBC_01233]
MARWSRTSSSAARTSSLGCHGHGTRRSGRFGYRSVLPSGVKTEDAAATLADGVLPVTVPEARAATARGGERAP